MPFLISNPLGFLALLGIPAILLIHFLQRRAQVLPCSTLFLLNQTKKESMSGRKFDKIIHSVPLWMQLLMVLLLTLLMVQPRYIKSQSTQRICVVLDSSASMAAFKDNATKKIIEHVPEIQGHASHIELWVLDSDLSKPRIYHGNSIEELSESLQDWSPQSGTSTPQHVLRIGRSLVGHEGALVYLTDTPHTSIPYNASVLSVGTPQQNVGFTGVSYVEDGDRLLWQASLRNYSEAPATRSWHVETDKMSKSETHSVQLAPGELKVLQGAFPKNSTRIRILLEPDSFTFDDTMPLILPEEKRLHFKNLSEEKFTNLTSKIQSHFSGITSTGKNTDLYCLDAPAATNKFGTDPALVLLDSPATKKPYTVATIAAADHPLTEGLNWSKLLLTPEERWEPSKWDTPLVWMDTTPIISLREIPKGNGKIASQLLINFSIPDSNAMQQEAFALLLYRFLELQRKKKSTLMQSLTELSQPLDLKVDPQGLPLTLESTSIDGTLLSSEKLSPKHTVHAPSEMGFYSVKQGNSYLLHAANYFADTREADLSKCEEGVLEASSPINAVDQHSDEDRHWRTWVLLLMLALTLSWKYTKSPQITP